MTAPRGWRVCHLRDELGIAQRTYRKYRQTLQDDFYPWRRRDGTSSLIEIEDGDARYLRLRPPRALGATDPDLEAMAAAVYLARSLMIAMGSEPFRRAADMLTADFRASLRDRDFIMKGILTDAERMFIADAPEVDAPDMVVANLIRAVANRRKVQIVVAGNVVRVGAPLTIILRHSGLWCAIRFGDDEPSEMEVAHIEQADILSEQFEYPSASDWRPTTKKRDDDEK